MAARLLRIVLAMPSKSMRSFQTALCKGNLPVVFFIFLFSFGHQRLPHLDPFVGRQYSVLVAKGGRFPHFLSLGNEAKGLSFDSLCCSKSLSRSCTGQDNSAALCVVQEMLVVEISLCGEVIAPQGPSDTSSLPAVGGFVIAPLDKIHKTPMKFCSLKSLL